MQGALDLALAQPLGLALLLAAVWALATERVVPGPVHRRTLDVVERQQESLDSLAGTVETVLETARQTNATSELTLGLVRGVWREVIGPEPEPMRPYTPDWAEAGGNESLIELGERYFTPVALDAWGAGDVLVFRFRDGAPAKHVGIATGDDRMIHAHDGARVVEVPIVSFWRRRIVRAFSFPG